jgi:hypothetical protein
VHSCLHFSFGFLFDCLFGMQFDFCFDVVIFSVRNLLTLYSAYLFCKTLNDIFNALFTTSWGRYCVPILMTIRLIIFWGNIRCLFSKPYELDK